MKKLLLTTMAVLAVLTVSGCMTHEAPSYSPSFDDINALKKVKHNAKPIALGDFTDATNTSSITCRAEGNETLPGGVSYVQFIKNALQQSLDSADLYSDQSKIKLDATLSAITMSSMNGQWTISMTFNDHHQKPYAVTNTYSFDTSFIADIACEKASKEFVPAVQQFLVALYSNPHFQKTLTLN